MELQKLLDQPSHDISLPEGVLRGPAVIRHSCTIQGKNTVLWAESGPALIVESPGVVLRGLRICTKHGTGVCVRTASGDTELVSVSLLGRLEGFPEELPQYALPGVLRVGMFAPAPAVNRIPLTLCSPAVLRLSHSMPGVELSHTLLLPGENRIFVTVAGIEDRRTLYGSIWASRPTGVTRGIHLLGSASSGTRALCPDPQWKPSPCAIQTGNEIALSARRLRLRLDPPPPLEFEVEPFVFLLDDSGRAERDTDLIFYNNLQGQALCVNLGNDRDAPNKKILLNLYQMLPSVKRAAVCYCITSGTQPHLCFNRMEERLLYVEDMETGETVCVMPFGTSEAVRTLRMLELYRAEGGWKLLCRNAAYSESLDALLREYGLSATE